MAITVNLERIKGLIEQSLKEQPTGDKWLDARYDEQVAIIGHTNPYYRLFYLIAQQFKPVVVVELGGWQGTAAAHFAAGAPEATVISIDHHRDPGDDINRVRMLEVVDRFGVRYLQGWTTPGYEEEYHKGARSVFEDVKAILGERKIDILFIDSWHEGRYFKRDWDYYQPLLADPALVIVDDVFNDGFFVDMVETFETLPGQKFTNAELHRGIPIGFVHYGLSADRPAGRVKPETVSRPATGKPKVARKRKA